VKAVTITPPGAPLRGSAAPPGSKSITNRALLLAALAHGTSRLTGALKSDDTARMAEALAAMGVGIEEPDARAHEVIAAFPRMPAVIDGSQMQDAVPTLAVLAAFNATPVRFTGIANLRVKECDRISALSTELSRIRSGLGVEDGDDLLVASDPALAGQTLPARIETYADHRIAMSFALAGLKIGGIAILDPDCTAKTWPGYWDVLASLGVGLAFSGMP